jgi:peptide methionine sulfoxide reductase MsrB
VARYEPAQTRDARRAKENGIWLCQNCGRLVDADAQKFTIEVLTGWKRSAQERAFRISSKESENTLVPQPIPSRAANGFTEWIPALQVRCTNGGLAL